MLISIFNILKIVMNFSMLLKKNLKLFRKLITKCVKLMLKKLCELKQKKRNNLWNFGMELKNVLINDKLLVIVFLKLLLLNVMENKFLLLQKISSIMFIKLMIKDFLVMKMI
ncbi:MAG: hypothetical protein DBX97_23230 [Collinsella tanakaei]|nr:MAG: hypothetical protein DBX97_23230 [Collinsella tanakaei]